MTDFDSMTTALLPFPQHHFQSIPSQQYPIEQFPGLCYFRSAEMRLTDSSGQQVSGQTYALPTGVSIPVQHGTFTSPQRWAAKQAFRRPVSKSPNITDRTPIKHSRPDVNRQRSSSHSGALLAYAEDQARQMPKISPAITQEPFVPSMNPAAAAFAPSPHFPFAPQHPSPYLAQQPYFDATISQSNYGQLGGQPTNTQSLPTYMTPRPPMQMTTVPSQTMNPPDYTPSRAVPLPSVSSIPSNFPPMTQTLESTPNDADLVTNRQKPQCWDHGCNGRQFSTFSNLLRHQREKSGAATKARCPHCGTEFTRTTARNGHLYGGKCKGMPEALKESTKQPSDEGSS